MSSVERLLGTTTLGELTVSSIVEDAGLSRLAFYSYFHSKFDAVGAIVTQVMDTMYEHWRPFLDGSDDTDPLTALRRALMSSYDLMWLQHGAIGRTIHENWSSVPEVGDQYLAATERFTVGLAATIDHARATGVMPHGTDSRQVAAAALWASEQLIYVLHLGQSPDLPDFDSVLNLLTDLWSGLLFGGHNLRRTIDEP
jgi:TetR/AcrR family transcriptional regulator, ethionamide resistance regulator